MTILRTLSVLNVQIINMGYFVYFFTQYVKIFDVVGFSKYEILNLEHLCRKIGDSIPLLEHNGKAIKLGNKKK